MADALDTVTGETFKQQLHTSFRVHSENSDPIAMQLIEVREPPSAPGTELFCLHFRGPGSPRLAQKIWRFQHDKIGSLDLFMTAVGADEAGIVYEVVFHRLRKKRT
jgi:hypothetical protein